MKVVEVYSSIQGEGPNAGEPTTFIRFGGCNLRCTGWGTGELPDGSTVEGCDTIFAVYPEWRNTWRSSDVDSILRQVPPFPTRICITGGEPLVQPRSGMEALVKALLAAGHTIDLFTNGTRLLPAWALNDLVTVVMDFKLPGSGEFGKFQWSNLNFMPGKIHLKFVCKDIRDFETAVDLVQDEDIFGLVHTVWFGVVWDSQYNGNLTNQELSALLLKQVPWANLNIQMHNHIWPPNERGK